MKKIITLFLILIFSSNAYAAQKTYTIPDAQLQRIINGVVYQHGYKDTIKNNAGPDIPNPVTKIQYFDSVVYKFLKESVNAYEANRDAEIARTSATNKVNTEIVLQ